MSISSPAPVYSFLQGGGEMGLLTRTKDWRTTAVGDIAAWPQSLRTTLGIILHSKFPMFLFWGEALTCFYNDAYRPSLGNEGKHPAILGMAGHEAWPEIWDIIKPIIDQVLAGGEANWSEDQLIPIYRNGKMEDVYWTFSYSPVNNEAEKIAGVFVTCTETTLKVNSLKKLEQSERSFRTLIHQAPIAAAIFRGEDFVIEMANEASMQLWGKPKDIIGKKVVEAFSELKNQSYLQILKDVYETGITFEGKENLATLEKNGQPEWVYVTFIYKLLRGEDNKSNGILCMGYDVTEQVQARNQIKELEERNRLAIDANDIGVYEKNIVTGEVFFTDKMHQIYGSEKPLPPETYIDLIHPDDIAVRNKAHERALLTGKLDYQYRIILPDGSIRWIDSHAKIYYDNEGQPVRRIGTIQDITEQRTMLARIEETEKRFRDTVMQAPVGILLLKGLEFVVAMVNETYLQLVDREEDNFVGKSLFVSLPEVKEVVQPLLENVLATGIPYYGNEFEVAINRFGKKEMAYFNFIYQPLRESNGIISGVMVIASEVTQQVHAKFALQESQQQFSNLVMQSPIAMTIFRGPDFIIEIANEVMLKTIWRKEPHEVMGKKALEVFPELLNQKYPELLKAVYHTGRAHRENESVAYVQGKDRMKKFYLDFEYSPLYEKDKSISGLLITVNDVTQKVEARLQLEDAEARMRLAAEGTGLATWDLDLLTRQIIHTPRLAVIFGHSETTVLTHQQLREHIHPDDIHTVVEAAFERALQTSIYQYEARVVYPNGVVHWIQIQGKVLYNDDHQPARMLGTAWDITEQKEAERLINESEQKFRLLADSMPQLIWTGDPSGNLQYFSKTVYDYTGLSPQEVKESGWLDIVHPDDRPENIKTWLHAVQTGEPFLFEHRFRRFDGEYRWQLSRAIPQKDRQGAIQMWVGTSTDIDDIKKHDQQKDDFIKMASHELKTPVTTIKGYVQLLLKMTSNGKDAFLASTLFTIDKQIQKLTKLITDLLDVTKIETGSLELSKENFFIADTVREIAIELETTIQTHTITIHQHANPQVYGDKDRIAQVFVNLFNNAIKYSPGATGITVEISVRENQVLIAIEDAGIGILSGDLQRIFERFYRVAGKEEKTFPGFGIGLFIVDEIIRQHNGTIWAESEKDKGSVFYVLLPVVS